MAIGGYRLVDGNGTVLADNIGSRAQADKRAVRLVGQRRTSVYVELVGVPARPRCVEVWSPVRMR